MKLTREQQVKVEENLGLVYKVLGDKLKGQSAIGSYTREDLFQVGCIGLCKAAATDNMVYDCGTFVVKAADWTCHGSCPPTLPTRTPACTSTGWGQGLCGSGALSLMPKNYFRGMRRDVIEKLAERGIKVLR